jgi:hypothetical protein
LFGLFKKNQPSEPPKRFPPVPDWRPSIIQPIEQIADRIRHYTNGTKDFAIFSYGTVAILPNGLDDVKGDAYAKDALHKVFHAHPDMEPLNMKDGNILVRYSHDVVNVVLSGIIDQNWSEIEQKHMQALATDEVLITSLGSNKFDDFGKKSLFGRCFMFLDAQAPQVIKIERRTA